MYLEKNKNSYRINYLKGAMSAECKIYDSKSVPHSVWTEPYNFNPMTCNALYKYNVFDTLNTIFVWNIHLYVLDDSGTRDLYESSPSLCFSCITYIQITVLILQIPCKVVHSKLFLQHTQILNITSCVW